MHVFLCVNKLIDNNGFSISYDPVKKMYRITLNDSKIRNLIPSAIFWYVNELDNNYDLMFNYFSMRVKGLLNKSLLFHLKSIIILLQKFLSIASTCHSLK